MERLRDTFTSIRCYFVGLLLCSFFSCSDCTLGGPLLSSFISVFLMGVGMFFNGNCLHHRKLRMNQVRSYKNEKEHIFLRVASTQDLKLTVPKGLLSSTRDPTLIPRREHGRHTTANQRSTWDSCALTPNLSKIASRTSKEHD